jgi:hypothetical protein
MSLPHSSTAATSAEQRPCGRVGSSSSCGETQLEKRKSPLRRPLPEKRKPKSEPIVLYITLDASDLLAAIRAATRNAKQLKAALEAIDQTKVKIASSTEPDTSGLFDLRGGGGRP